MSSVGDDVTAYTTKLTEMERRLFQSAAVAASNHAAWKVFGHGQLIPRVSKEIRTVSPETTKEGDSNKRRRLQ